MNALIPITLLHDAYGPDELAASGRGVADSDPVTPGAVVVVQSMARRATLAG